MSSGTTVYVTHDQTEDDARRPRRRDEARGAPAGRLAAGLYARPVNLFVAGFIGSPAMNLVEDLPLAHGDGTFVEFLAAGACDLAEVESASGLAGYRD